MPEKIRHEDELAGQRGNLPENSELATEVAQPEPEGTPAELSKQSVEEVPASLDIESPQPSTKISLIQTERPVEKPSGFEPTDETAGAISETVEPPVPELKEATAEQVMPKNTVEAPKEGEVSSESIDQEKIEPIPAGMEGEKPPKDEKEARVALESELIGTFANIVESYRLKEGSDEFLSHDQERAQIFYEKAGGIFESLTGENFDEKVKSQTRQELENKGYRIMNKQEYFGQERQDKVRERVQKGVWAVGRQAAWDSLSDAEKASTGGKEEFAAQLEAARIALAEKGLDLSPDVYYNLFREGYDPRTVKERGLFSKRLEMKKLDGSKAQFRKDLFVTGVTDSQKKFDELTDKITAGRLSKGYDAGRGRYMKAKLENAGKIVVEATADFQETDTASQNVPVSEMVEVKTMTFEQEKQEAQKEAERRLGELEKVVRSIAVDLSLRQEQIIKFGKYVGSGKGNIDYIPEETRELLPALVVKKAEIEKAKETKINEIKKRAVIAQRKRVMQKLAEI